MNVCVGGGRGMNECVGGREGYECVWGGEGRGGKGMNVCVVGGGKREGFFVRVNINRQTCIKGYKICHWSKYLINFANL